MRFAWGFGGQFIIVIPHLSIVVAMTGANYENSVQQFNILREQILPVLN